jgi:hypothetical protein
MGRALNRLVFDDRTTTITGGRALTAVARRDTMAQ